MTDSQQDQAAVEARARELLACRACGAPCSVQVFEGPSISATLWMCSNHVKLRGDCPDTNAYLSEDAWNTRPALSTPAYPVAGDVEDLAEAVHRGRFKDDQEPTPFRDEDSAGRAYCFRIARSVYDAAVARQPALPAGGDASDMAAFGASDAACYYYPGEDQQKERTAFCAGAVHHHAPIREDALREAAAVARSHDYMQCGPHTREVTTAIEAAILARIDSPTAAVPTVPRAPTEVMIEAGARAYDFPSAFMGGGSQQGKQTAARVWAAMEASRIRALSPNEASDGEGL